MSSRPSAWRISQSARGGCTGKASSSFACSKRPSTTSRSLRRPALVGHVPALLAEPREHVVDVAHQLDLGDEVGVGLGRHRVDADDLSCRASGSSARASARRGRSRSPAPRRPRRTRPSRSRPTGGPPSPSALSLSARQQPLAHEGLGHRDAGGAHELAQRRRRLRADHAVARQRHRLDRAADEVGRPQQLARRRLRRAPRACAAAARPPSRWPSRPRAARCAWRRASRPRPP